MRGIAVIGSRRATPYGLRMTERLVTDLVAHGYCIVSGLARGIDAMAHRTALRVGGRTIAILGSGLLSIYPPEHAGLADEVAKHGALLSEFAPRTPPRAGQFPQRNRLLSGLVEGVLVVEAGTRSGALITVRMALEQGREVFAVPGPVDRESSRGCHSLLKDGAILVESVADIMDELEPQALAKSTAGPRHAVQPGRPSAGHGVQPIEPELDDPQQRVVYDLVTSEPRLIDEVIARSGLTAPQALAAIGALELRRLIGRINGPFLQRLAPLPVEAVRRMPLPR
jgi:DNA processing protein